MVDLRSREGDVEGRWFSWLAPEVALNEAASDRDPNLGRGLNRRPGRVFSFVGLGIGILEVLRLSVKKSGGCCDSTERAVNKGWSRFKWPTESFLFLPSGSGLIGAMALGPVS